MSRWSTPRCRACCRSSTRECVRQAVRTGLGLKAQINKRSSFDRKNYFYPDLPQGYQISQYKSPIVGEGEIQVDLTPEHSIKVGIERLHLEQDAGKSLHDQSPTMSFVDLNRSGVALMEIVSKPDMRSADEAKAYVTQAAHDPALHRLVRRRHGEGEPSRRRQRLRAQARRAASARAARSRTSTRSASSARRSTSRRVGRSRVIEDGGVDRAGDAAVRSRARRDALDALQGRGARLPLFPRSRPVAARVRRRVHRRACRRNCRSCRTRRRPASCGITGFPPMTRRSSSPSARPRLSSRRRRARRRQARREGGRQLDHGRSLRAAPTRTASASPTRA